jgi:hypothetical protein
LLAPRPAGVDLTSPRTPADFHQANRWYEEGKFLDAIRAYQSLLHDGPSSAPLLFNLGNAFLKSGQIGRARACYLLALELQPRDPAIRGNLRWTTQAAGKESRAWWENLIASLRFLSLNEWTLLTTLALWSWCGLLTAGILHPRLKPKLARSRSILLIFLTLMIIALTTNLYDRWGITRAIVIQSPAELRRGPIKESQVFASLNDGAIVKTLDRQDPWIEVLCGDQTTGWLPSELVVLLQPGTLPTNLFLPLPPLAQP